MNCMQVDNMLSGNPTCMIGFLESHIRIYFLEFVKNEPPLMAYMEINNIHLP